MLLVVISFPVGPFPSISAKGQEAVLSNSFWFALFPGALGSEGRGPTFPPPSGCCAGEIWPGGSQELGRSPGPRMEAPPPTPLQCVAGTLVRLCSQSGEAVARGSGVRAPRDQLEQKHAQGPRAWAVAVPPLVSAQLVCFASVPRSWRLF